jgi:hypothetical protein
MTNRSELVDELIAQTPGWRGEVFAKLREIIHEADPEIIEEVKWKRPSNPMGAPVFEHNGIVCVVVALKERVRITFDHGTSLPVAQEQFNAMLKGKSRAIDYREGDRIDEQALAQVVRAAVARNLARPARRKR